jgi:hypothetical protein
VGQTLNVGIVEPTIIDFISTCAPKLLDKFKVLIKLTYEFLGKKLHSNYCHAIVASKKLPLYWENLGKGVAYRVIIW